MIRTKSKYKKIYFDFLFYNLSLIFFFVMIMQFVDLFYNMSFLQCYMFCICSVFFWSHFFFQHCRLFVCYFPIVSCFLLFML